MKFVVLLMVIFGTAAHAQESEDTNIQYKRVTELELDTVSLDAVATKPELTAIAESPRPKFNSMIKLRTDFIPEMKTALLEVH